MDAPRGSRVPIIVVLGLLGLAAAVQFFMFYRRLHPSDLDAWVAHVQRSGRSLMMKTEKSGRYAVFDAGGDRLSFCVKSLNPAKGRTACSTAVLDDQGKDLE